MDKDQKWIDTYTAAEMLGMTPRGVRKQCAEGKIDGARKYGRLWRIPASSVKPQTNAFKSAQQPSE